ncbi:MAG: glycosyltransferase [Oscillospiraceae bacterium]|nr:glycosyltransferase [Oscillospiraceae bacterium]
MDHRTRLKVIRLKKNSGLGNALRTALENSSYGLVARMDSDDISLPDRFGLQLRAFAENNSADVVGGYISEFVGDPGNITGIRTVELEDAQIKQDMKKRCAMNHVSVMFRKDAVIRAGGYLDWYSNEDYYLWIRMIESGCVFMNVPYVLVNVRTGSGMSARRGGWKYFKSEQGIQKLMLEKGMIGTARYLYNVAVRVAGELIASGPVRQILFRIIRKAPDSVASEPVPEESLGQQEHEPFSVAMSVYGKDDPEWFDTSMNSLLSQTVVPDEIVLVIDGPVPDSIEEVISKYAGLCGSVSQE